MTKEQMKKEAIRRLKELGLMKDVIKAFEKEQPVIYYSERQNAYLDGILYWVNDDEKLNSVVKEFEKKHDAIVYHAILTHTEFGDLFSLLYVSSNEGKFEDDWVVESPYLEKDIKNNPYFLVRSYVSNLDYPGESEFGDIGIAPRNGGLSRVY